MQGLHAGALGVGELVELGGEAEQRQGRGARAEQVAHQTLEAVLVEGAGRREGGGDDRDDAFYWLWHMELSTDDTEFRPIQPQPCVVDQP
jgi:hypothetical protein